MCVAALTLISTAVGVAGSLMQGQQVQAAADAQAAALEQQAQAEQKAAAYEATQRDKQNRLAQSAAKAAIGASGVGFAGSPTEALVANAGQNQLDLQAIQFGSTIKQNNLRTQADISRMQGKQAKQASFINAGSGLLSGVSSLYDPSKATTIGNSYNPFR